MESEGANASSTARPSAGPAPLGWRRLLVRFLACGIALIALDLAVRVWLPPSSFGPEYRLPRDAPTTELPAFLDHVGIATRPDTLDVVFLGASPTWGEGVEQARGTVPAALSRQVESPAGPVSSYNLAFNGQLLGDAYLIADRMPDAVDVVFVQLTYHGFNPRWRDGRSLRVPELPRIIGAHVSPDVAEVLGVEPSHRFDITGRVEQTFRDVWYLYGARDRLSEVLFGAPPEAAINRVWTQTLAGGPDELARPISTTPFVEREPDEQMLIIDEFADTADFEISDLDSETRMLRLLADSLRDEGRFAVFYISPLNTEALTSFELFDRGRYTENVRRLREIVEVRGHRFLDLNDPSIVPPEEFTDISHATATGNALVAETLARTLAGGSGR